MEMGALEHRTVVEKQVHQHGLAASDLAINVEPARSSRILVGEQALQQPATSRPVSRKAGFQPGIGFDSLSLRRIGLDRACGNERLIVPTERGWGKSIHGR